MRCLSLLRSHQRIKVVDQWRNACLECVRCWLLSREQYKNVSFKKSVSMNKVLFSCVCRSVIKSDCLTCVRSWMQYPCRKKKKRQLRSCLYSHSFLPLSLFSVMIIAAVYEIPLKMPGASKLGPPVPLVMHSFIRSFYSKVWGA